MTNPTTFRTPVFCFASGGMYDQYAFTVIVQTELGYTSEYHDGVMERAPADVREAYEAEQAMLEAQYGSFPDGMFDGPEEEVSYFRTIEDAAEYALACDAIHGISDDLAAFHAPAECGAIAYARAQERYNAAVAKEIKAHAPDLNWKPITNPDWGYAW